LEAADLTGAGLSLHPGLEDALLLCFDAVMAPDLWPEATERLAEAMDGLGVCFHLRGAAPGQRMSAPMSGRYRDLLSDMLPGGWTPLDVRGARGWPLAERGKLIFTEAEITTAAERTRLPIYADLFRRHDLGSWAGTVLQVEDELWAFNVVRSERMGEVGEAHFSDTRRLALARPYLRRLLSYSKALAAAATEGAFEALESSGTAAVVLNASGRVALVTTQAIPYLRDGLRIRNGRLGAEGSVAGGLLEARIAAALSGAGSAAGADAGPLCLPRPGGEALLVDVLPLRGDLAQAFGRCAVLVKFWDPSRRSRPAAAVLRQAFGLTPREAQVAALLGAGEGVPEISDALGLKASSVRQIVKTVLSKAGARRQSEFVAMVASSPDRS
jgi:DNA-binding CsgD family transcriptional regulator